MSELTIGYELEGIGWSRLAIEAGDDRIEIGRLSHAGEPLHDLLWAALAAALGRTPEGLLLDHERWRTELGFGARDDGQLEIFADERWWIEDRAFSQPLGAAPAVPERFAVAVRDEAAGLLARHGPAGYDDLWRARGFPTRALAALEAALGTEEAVGYGDRG